MSAKGIKSDRPIVSVIMPAYNAEATLRRSAESVLASTCRDIELLIIDDGSKDGTAKVCRALAEEDPRVWTVTVKNSGPAAARNLGLDAARGEFVTFVDSDDLIDPNMFTAMLQGVAVHNADVSVCGATIEYPDGSRENSRVSFGVSGMYEGERLRELFDLPGMTLFYAGWCKLFRRELIEEHGLRMDTAYRITEDTDFTMRYMQKARSVYLIDECFYHYMQVNTGSLTMVKDPEQLKKAAFNVTHRLGELMRAWGADEGRIERDCGEHLYSQLNAASFIKLRGASPTADKRRFVIETLKTPGFRAWLRRGRFSSRVLSLGFVPALAYVKAHGVYLKLRGR